MDKQEFLDHMQELIRRGVPYVDGGRAIESGLDCEGFFRYAFRLWGIEIGENLFIARNDFEPLTGPPRFMDAALFRAETLDRRHLVVMLDRRWFIHCSKITNGIAKSEITRPPYQGEAVYFARHTFFAAYEEPDLCA